MPTRAAFSWKVATTVLLCGAAGAGSWWLYLSALSNRLGIDGMVFQTAIQAWMNGNASHLYDGVWLTEQINRQFADWLGVWIPLHPWVYPPTFLLYLVPFGALPAAAGIVGFQAVSILALVVAVFTTLRAPGWILLGLLFSPAAAANVALMQNGFLISALLLGGAGLLRNAPIVAGILWGALSFKPQFMILIPVALVASRQWQTAIAGAVTALLIGFVSVMVFGLQPWLDWLHLLTAGTSQFTDWQTEARLKGMSLFAFAVALGATPRVAIAAQAAAILAGVVSVYCAYRRPLREDLRIAVLLAAALLAAPHSGNYDAIMLTIAASLLFLVTVEEGLRLREIVLIVAVWICPLLVPPRPETALVPPLVMVALIGAILIRRGPTAVVTK